LLIRRDFLTRYRQTILGPVWFVLQPLVMAGIFSLVFSRSERLQTSEVPPLLFYLSGLLGWTYFAQALGLVGTTFTNNALLFSKAYFPPLLVPISIVTSGLISMALQLAVFLVFCGYFAWLTPHDGLQIGWQLALLPLLIVQTVLFTLGAGLWIATFTARYRDLQHALQFITLGWMFLTPVFIPLSQFSGRLVVIAYLNPVAPIVEGYRSILLGTDSLSWPLVAVSVVETLVVFLGGVLLFQRVERTVVDTV
jgi:lipopolysaccharide transport system permease protein